MEIFRFYANIRLRHPAMDPDEISTALGLTSKTKWKVGTPRKRPDGTVMGGTYKYTYWTSVPREGEDSGLLSTLESDLLEFEKHISFFSAFHVSGGRAEYYISWFASQRSGGEMISHLQLGRLASLHINLSLDVYSHSYRDTQSCEAEPDLATLPTKS